MHRLKCIGKESNSLENVDEGMIHSEQNVYTEDADPKRTEWITKIQPTLKKPKLEVLVEACGKQLCRREIIELRAGRKKLHRRTQQLLESILNRLGFLQRVDQSIAGPWTNGPVPKLPVTRRQARTKPACMNH
jgi:hypothetical protein